MIQFFRRFFQSKVGVAITLAFLGLIAFAFASSDVANTGTFGGVAGGDRVAVVGDTRIDAIDLSSRTSDVLNNVRQQNPTLTMEAFIANGGLADVLEEMISRTALADLGQRFGLRAGSRLVDSEIVGMANMRTITGEFDTEAFRAVLRQQGISEDMFRDDLAMGLFARQMAGPVQLVPRMPQSVAARYTRLRLETRRGEVAELLASRFAPTGAPSNAQLQAYFDANRDDYIRPERRVVRYAVFGEDAFGARSTPTPDQIAERYERDAELYAARESRSFTQLVAPTQAAAQAIVEEVRGGMTMEASARSKGLVTTNIPATTEADLGRQASAAVATAAFAANEGAVTAPAQGGLGWYVLRVDNIDRQPARTLAQATPEITEALGAELRRAALSEAIGSIEDQFAEGRSLADVAGELGVELLSTRPITAAGQVYGTPEPAPEAIAPVLAVAFEMDEGEPQLAEAVAGESFIVFDVADITASAVAPLAEIRDQVVTAWRRDEGMKAAGAAAERILARIDAGSTLAQAVAAEQVSLPAPAALVLNRAEVERTGQITRPVALFFSMASGTTKTLETPESEAWYLLALNEVTAPEVEADDPLVATTASQLLPFVPEEYTAQFVSAVRSEVDIDINQVAVDAVAAQLTGRTR
ncbi:SurA N-terminal domain-containing protein [Altererythrobacter sp. KTW20L]|uniref:peptidylprolyl isomerase n=1 Tax=Altererythrobacter sp. KTW20L TaxID=2942210 RepID=UPI0020C15943|nr:peptidylprolyl isomerase [Altererythrobacter sp. KTW20L]MCL6251941.1 SurA N-terminal domain-containing protein [Altererythrobacter sp. KTW20L]